MGIAAVVLLVQPHQRHGIPHPALDAGLVILAVDMQRLGQRPGHGKGGVQTARRVLKDHLGPLGVVGHGAGHVALHAQYGPGQRGLAAAALPHQSQNFAPVQGKADVVQHLRPPLAQTAAAAVPDVQVFDFQYGL